VSKNINKQCKIYFYGDHQDYKTDASPSTHAEILGGLLFEAANVYVGSPDRQTDKERQAAEIPVTLFNCLQNAIRVKEGIPITQIEWRNLVPVFFSDVDPKTFKMSNRYPDFWHETDHGPGNYST
jgi:hypothetical protein